MHSLPSGLEAIGDLAVDSPLSIMIPPLWCPPNKHGKADLATQNASKWRKIGKNLLGLRRALESAGTRGKKKAGLGGWQIF